MEKSWLQKMTEESVLPCLMQEAFGVNGLQFWFMREISREQSLKMKNISEAYVFVSMPLRG